MAWYDAARAITDRVIQARQEARLSKVDFATLIGITKQAYTPYEQYAIEFTLEQLFIISRKLGKPVEWLLGLPTEMTPDEQELLALYRELHPDFRRMVLEVTRAQVKFANRLGGAKPEEPTDQKSTDQT